MSAVFVQEDARAIAAKLQAGIKQGRKHDIAILRIGGKHIAQFGIQRASKDKSHNYIHLQLFMSNKQCRQFRDCTFTRNQYIEFLRSKGHLG